MTIYYYKERFDVVGWAEAEDASNNYRLALRSPDAHIIFLPVTAMGLAADGGMPEIIQTLLEQLPGDPWTYRPNGRQPAPGDVAF